MTGEGVFVCLSSIQLLPKINSSKRMKIFALIAH